MEQQTCQTSRRVHCDRSRYRSRNRRGYTLRSGSGCLTIGVHLTSITSLEAVLIAAFVLMRQNRMSIIADRRDHLDLQVNLLTERKATQIIQMVDRLSTHLGVEQHHNEDSRELGRHVAVEHLVEEVHSRLPHVSGP